MAQKAKSDELVTLQELAVSSGYEIAALWQCWNAKASSPSKK